LSTTIIGLVGSHHPVLDELTSAPQMTQAGWFSVSAGASDNCFSAGLTGASCGIATATERRYRHQQDRKSLS